MKKPVYFPGVAVLVVVLLCRLSGPLRAECQDAAPGSCPPPISTSALEKTGSPQEAQNLLHQIQTLNLVNSLYLAKEQISALLALADEYDKVQQHFRKELGSYEAENVRVLKKIKEELSRSDTVSLETEWMLNELDRRKDELLLALEKEKLGLVQRAQGVLTENQLILAGQYQPCIIPGRSAVDPERVGQAAGGDYIEIVLAKARSLPEKEYLVFKKGFMDETRDKLLVQEGPGNLEQRLRDIDEAFTRARGMTAQDFELTREKLAQVIEPPRAGAGCTSCEQSRTIEQYLLSRDSAAVLRSRLQTAGK